MDGADIDDDGDGLIEIRTAAQLDAVRYALNGDGRKLSASAELDDTGCGGAGGITSCSGYELVADISLAAYANNEGGKGWQPLGHDIDDTTTGCQGAAFNGTFEGNGRTISDLSISRSGEDCVGLFGYIAEGSEIRDLMLSAKTVIGRARVGGLVGWGSSATIVYSSVVAAEVSGTGQNVGGLIGWGSSARIVSSSVVAAEVNGSGFVGGLAGWGDSARVYSSSVVVSEVIAGSFPGGLMGSGTESWVYSSSVVVGEVIGRAFVSGLIGSFNSGQVAYSYLVSGSNTAMLARFAIGTRGVASYWDNETSGVTIGNTGDPKTTSELRSPTGYTDIYANWTKDTDIFGDGMINEPLAVWCDKDNSGSIEIGEKTPDNLIWDFGESDEYPAIRCTPISPSEWRDWWFLNATNQPQLDQSRLDQLLP